MTAPAVKAPDALDDTVEVRSVDVGLWIGTKWLKPGATLRLPRSVAESLKPRIEIL